MEAFDYQMLISFRLFPASLPNKELSYCFPKFLYDQFQNSIHLTYISKFGQQNLIYNSFSREFTMTYFVQIGVTKDRYTKMYPKYFNGNVNITFVLFYQFLVMINLSMTQRLRLGFLKTLSLSQKLLIVLKSLAFW